MFNLIGTALISFIFGAVVAYFALKFVKRNNPDLPL